MYFQYKEPAPLNPPFRYFSHKKWKQKMIAKPGRLSGLRCSEQPFPTQQEKESQRGRAAEITHSTIYCPKTTSSTKGTTVIIGVKIHSLLTCECDLQHGFIPSKRAFGSQERWAHQLQAAVRGWGCVQVRGASHRKRGAFSWHCTATTFQNASR